MFLMFHSTASSQDREIDPAEMMAWNDLAAEHEQLAQFTGEWSVIITLAAGGAEQTYEGTSSHRLAAKGRFLLLDYQGVSTNEAPVGLFTLGFDRRHKRFTIQAIDTWGTYFVTAQGGPIADNSRILKLFGTDDDPYMASLGYTKEFAYQVDMSIDDRLSIDVFMIDTRTSERLERKMMSYVFSRKTSSP